MHLVEEEDDKIRKGTWLEEEDERLISFVQLMGDKKWDSLAKASGLKRSGKSCRLRWLNYLRPNLKHGQITIEEENIILQLHKQWGNKWSKIARRLPGRTDNEIKNYWRTHLRKKVSQLQAQENEINIAKEDDFVMFEIEKNESIISAPNTKHNKYENSNNNNNNNNNKIIDHYDSSLEGLFGSDYKCENSPEASATSAEFSVTSSPFENRFSEWIFEYSIVDCQSDKKCQNDESFIDVECSSCSDHLGYYCDYISDNYSWDYCSDFLWEHELITN